MNGICELRRFIFFILYLIENCKIGCLYDLRCFGFDYIGYGYCIEYMYKEIYGCYLLRYVIYFIYKGNYIVSYLIKFLFNVLNYVFVRKDV